MVCACSDSFLQDVNVTPHTHRYLPLSTLATNSSACLCLVIHIYTLTKEGYRGMGWQVPGQGQAVSCRSRAELWVAEFSLCSYNYLLVALGASSLSPVETLVQRA